MPGVERLEEGPASTFSALRKDDQAGSPSNDSTVTAPGFNLLITKDPIDEAGLIGGGTPCLQEK
jgi:hypothetical protein